MLTQFTVVYFIINTFLPTHKQVSCGDTLNLYPKVGWPAKQYIAVFIKTALLLCDLSTA